MDGLANNGDSRTLVDSTVVVDRKRRDPDLLQLSEKNERNSRHRPNDSFSGRSGSVAGKNFTDGFSIGLEIEERGGQERRRVATIHPPPATSGSGQGNENAVGQANETKPRGAYESTNTTTDDADKTTEATHGKDEWSEWRKYAGVQPGEPFDVAGHGYAPPSHSQKQPGRRSSPASSLDGPFRENKMPVLETFDLDELFRQLDTPTECVERNRQKTNDANARKRERGRLYHEQKSVNARKTTTAATVRTANESAQAQNAAAGRHLTVDDSKQSSPRVDKKRKTGLKRTVPAATTNDDVVAFASANSGPTLIKRTRRQQPTVANDVLVGRTRGEVIRNMKFVTFYTCDACLENLKTIFRNARSNLQLYLCHECTQSNTSVIVAP